MGLFGGKWVTIRTASGSKMDDVDRLYAIFKSSGIKSKLKEDGKVKSISVKTKDEAAARVLAEQFDKER